MRFEIREEYQQATLIKRMIVEAKSLQDAHDDPQSCKILDSALEIDFGGEARTVGAKKTRAKVIGTRRDQIKVDREKIIYF